MQVGDLVEYYDPMLGVAGESHTKITAIVLGVRKKGMPKLVIGTGLVLPKTHAVKRIHTLSEDGTQFVDGWEPGQYFVVSISHSCFVLLTYLL